MMHTWIYALMFLVLPICCRSTNSTSSNSIYRESESTYQPSECRKSIRPVYFLENTADAYRLVVTIPEKVSRKDLKIDVDYNEGHIEVFGWWFEGKIRGEAAKKTCVYSRWILDSDLLSEEAIVSSDLVSVYDIFMSMHGKQLILSVPTAIDQNSFGSPSPPPPTPIENSDNDNEHEAIANHASIVIAYGTNLWKKLRGLVRLKDHARNYSNDEFSTNNSILAPSSWDVDAGRPPSSLAYAKYRQDALENFLAYAMGKIDKNTNW
jgi:hypothetical protein